MQEKSHPQDIVNTLWSWLQLHVILFYNSWLCVSYQLWNNKSQKKNQGVFVKHYSMPPAATKSNKSNANVAKYARRVNLRGK